MSEHHAAVWIDQHEARVFHIDGERLDESTLRAPRHHLRRHPESEGGKHPDDAKRFFAQVAGALEGAEEVLVLGPSTAKLHFLKYVHAHAPSLEPRIVGVETVDHPTDPQLHAYARKYFDGVDRPKGRTP